MKSEKRFTVSLVVLSLWLTSVVPLQAQTTRPRVTSQQSATSVPRTTPTPTPTPTPAVGLPTAAASPTPFPGSGQTIEDLQSRIRQRISAFDVRRGRIGVKIASLATGKTIFENDADKYFMPASNMKNFTVAAALEKLTPEFKFVTSVYANAPVDGTGVIRGDLRIFGRGDISVSTAFFGTSASDPQTYYKGIDNLVDRIAAAGVKRVEGSIVGDESYFKGSAIPGSWEWDDLQWYYGAEISALPINDNAVDIIVVPGTVGSPCVVTISPANTLFQVNNLCTTSGAGVKRSLGVHKRLDRNVLEITGTMPAGDSGFRNSITITRPAELFVALLKQRLEAKGIVVTGQTRTLPPGAKGDSSQVEIARLESPPLSLIAAKTMKPSQNMYTETLLWTLGEQLGRNGDANPDSAQLGINVVKSFMKQIGIPDDSLVQYDIA